MISLTWEGDGLSPTHSRSNNHRAGSNITRVRGDSNVDHYIHQPAHWQKWAKCTTSHAEGLCRLVTQNVGLLLKTDTRRNEWPWEAPLRLITNTAPVPTLLCVPREQQSGLSGASVRRERTRKENHLTLRPLFSCVICAAQAQVTTFFRNFPSQLWWCVPRLPALGRQTQANLSLNQPALRSKF